MCVFSQACVKVAARGGKQCVCGGGSSRSHNAQTTMTAVKTTCVRLCDVSVGSSRDREEQAHAETICQLQIL